MKRIFSLLKVIGNGAVKPLPLSGIITAVKEVRESKFELEKVLKLAVYLLVGIALWGFITGKITIDDLIQIINALGLNG